MTESQKSFRYPENVEIFKETVEAKPFIKEGKHLANIYGFSYSKRHITQNMTSHYIKENSAVPFHLGLLHGNLSGREDHDPYAPFTIPELLEQDFDYWALGHIHKREILHSHPPIVYPGNIQGRSKKETGEKGCYIVELTEGGNPELAFIETAPIQWTSLEVSINNLQTMDQLIETVKQSMEANRREETGILTELAFTGSGELHAALQDENYCEDLVVLLNEGEEKNASFHYVYSLKSLTTAAYSKSELKEKSFYRDFYSIVEQTENLDSVLSALYRQSEARHYIDALDTMEQKAILEEAEQWLVTRFLESEKR
jgi:DNA repair exonuclease SbcCD nuclease subunit